MKPLLLKKNKIFYAIPCGGSFMTNFDIFTATPQFESFASVAISAERILHDKFRFFAIRRRLLLLRLRSRLRRADSTYRPLRLRAELPQGDGVCCKMDVLGG